jgi:hypothetical protein
MQVRFDRGAYRNRVQVETVMSMIKRRQGSHAPARRYHSQCRDLYLMALTHNVMILLVLRVFYRAVPLPLRPEAIRLPREALPLFFPQSFS